MPYASGACFTTMLSLRSLPGRASALKLLPSVRDVLSQRRVLTESTYGRENPKRIYYLSMEFLIGRALTSNVTNLLLFPS